jgi:hypothetical protein
LFGWQAGQEPGNHAQASLLIDRVCLLRVPCRSLFDTRTQQVVRSIETESPVLSVEVGCYSGAMTSAPALLLPHVVCALLQIQSCSPPSMCTSWWHLQVSFDGRHITTAEGRIVRFFDAASMTQVCRCGVIASVTSKDCSRVWNTTWSWSMHLTQLA